MESPAGCDQQGGKDQRIRGTILSDRVSKDYASPAGKSQKARRTQ